MKDNDIIKALKCCKEGNCDDGCPFYGVKEDCEAELPEEALNVINRQQAEIERLQKENKITREYLHDNGLEWDLLSYSKRKEHN